MKKENDKPSVITPKTVIFCHPAADFKLDRNIRRKAVYIRDCYLENHEERVIYYAMKIKKALLSKKSYLVVNFNQLVIQVFEAILTNQDTWDYKGWSFMAFFHDDEDNGAGEHIPPDVKREILIGMYHNSYMMEYTIPRGYTLTEQDIKDIKEWWDWPKKEKNFPCPMTTGREKLILYIGVTRIAPSHIALYPEYPVSGRGLFQAWKQTS